MTKVQQSERDECIARLRETLKPGQTVYTSLKHCSRSGMQREISLHIVADGQIQWITGVAARAMGDRIGKRDGIVIGGCGMDMGFELVYRLSHVLWPSGIDCPGDVCRSNDHTNAGNANHHGQCAVCGAHLAKRAKRFERINGANGWMVQVCSETCQSGPWHHRDGGYTLEHNWI